MSQLDVSISFSHLFGLLLCSYFFVHYIAFLLVNFWYSWKLRALIIKARTIQLHKNVYVEVIQKILKV